MNSFRIIRAYLKRLALEFNMNELTKRIQNLYGPAVSEYAEAAAKDAGIDKDSLSSEDFDRIRRDINSFFTKFYAMLEEKHRTGNQFQDDDSRKSLARAFYLCRNGNHNAFLDEGWDFLSEILENIVKEDFGPHKISKNTH